MSINPYESPKQEADNVKPPLGELVFYQSDSRRLTVREYWRLSGNPLQFLLALTLKLCGIRLPMNFAFASAGATHSIRPDQRSEFARNALAGLEKDAADCGLRYVFSYVLPSMGAVESLASTYANQDGTIVVPLVFVRMWFKTTMQKTAYAFLSRMANGQLLVTSGTKQELDIPPGYLTEFWPNAPFATVLARHRERMVAMGVPALAAPTDVDIAACIRENEQRVMDFHVERGTYVPATAAELERLTKLESQTAAAGPAKSTAFQGWEVICWVAMAIALLLASRELPGKGIDPTRLFLYLFLAGVALMGILAIWIYRAIENRKARQS